MNKPVSKKFGGQERASEARLALSEIFSNHKHPLFLEKDIDLAKKYDVSRLTIYSIREQLEIPPRNERILKVLKEINTKDYTKKELAELLKVKYQNLYKIVRESNIEVKMDTLPIEAVLKSQKEKSKNNIAKKTVTKK
jgi:DNA-binding XRE family transcriptional regulator